MSADTLPAGALDLALDGFTGTYADGTPLSVTDALLAALLAAAPSIKDQQRDQIRKLAEGTGAICTEGEFAGCLFAELLGEPGQERSNEDEAASPLAAELDGPEEPA